MDQAVAVIGLHNCNAVFPVLIHVSSNVSNQVEFFSLPPLGFPIEARDVVGFQTITKALCKDVSLLHSSDPLETKVVYRQLTTIAQLHDSYPVAEFDAFLVRTRQPCASRFVLIPASTTIMFGVILMPPFYGTDIVNYSLLAGIRLIGSTLRVSASLTTTGVMPIGSIRPNLVSLTANVAQAPGVNTLIDILQKLVNWWIPCSTNGVNVGGEWIPCSTNGVNVGGDQFSLDFIALGNSVDHLTSTSLGWKVDLWKESRFYDQRLRVTAEVQCLINILKYNTFFMLFIVMFFIS